MDLLIVYVLCIYVLFMKLNGKLDKFDAGSGLYNKYFIMLYTNVVVTRYSTKIEYLNAMQESILFFLNYICHKKKNVFIRLIINSYSKLITYNL